MPFYYSTYKNTFFDGRYTMYSIVYKLHRDITTKAKYDLEESLIKKERNKTEDLRKFTIRRNICSHIFKEFY